MTNPAERKRAITKVGQCIAREALRIVVRHLLTQLPGVHIEQLIKEVLRSRGIDL